jgi:DNA polymerase-3 subunit alpha
VLQEDALLRVTAKVDRRNEGIQLVLESVARLDPAAAPPPDTTLPTAMDLEGLGESEPPPPTNDERRTTNDHRPPTNDHRRTTTDERPPTNDEQRPDGLASDPAVRLPPPETQNSNAQRAPETQNSSAAPLAEPVSIIRPKAATKAAKAANGSAGGNPRHASSPGNDGPSNGSGRSLRLRLPHTHDFDTGVQLMQQVYELLRQSSGEDAVIIQLPKDEGVVLLKPRSGVSASVALVGQLSDLLGADRVLVD